MRAPGETPSRRDEKCGGGKAIVANAETTDNEGLRCNADIRIYTIQWSRSFPLRLYRLSVFVFPDGKACGSFFPRPLRTPTAGLSDSVSPRDKFANLTTPTSASGLEEVRVH